MMVHMIASPKVFIIILNWNGKERIIPCLRSVFSLGYGNFEVVVVDNASRDGSLELARSSFGRAHFIVNEKNAGFAAGMNVGIRFALSKGAEHVWVLNNDAIVGKDSLSELVGASGASGKAILSPLILTPSGKTWFSAGKIDFMRMRAVHIEPDVPSQAHEPYETGYLTGCALFVPRAAFEAVGLFDERFFLYYEDADFSIRAKHSGYELLVVPGAVVVHGEQSVENPEKIYWLVLSGLRFFEKRTPWFFRPWMSLYILLRKMKNKTDKKKGKKEAFLVASAYEDFQNPEKS
ncbi:MAG: glycosyltransferase family 2 protein [Candidatus Moranbacteria bacterium]|nr:glycosyltransferase family 2 protein [Candidatus Moranbacteria bacterium]